MHYLPLIAAAPFLGLASAGPCKPSALPVSSESNCQGTTYVNRGLVAYGTVASDARDKVGDTLGGFGSAITVDDGSFSLKKDGTISGTLFAVPDRGWNTQGTIDFQGRVHSFEVSFKPTFGKVGADGENLQMKLQNTLLLTKDKKPTTGLEAASIIPASGSLPDLPAAERPNGDVALTLDLEGVVRLSDGSFWISDEYGPYVYHFTQKGELDVAIQPPIAFIPLVNGEENFESGNPPVGSDEDAAPDPDTGRINNHGFEGLAISPDERYLTVQLQGATVEDGGGHATRENITRQLTYDISDRHHPKLISEFVVNMPAVDDPTEDKNPRATAVSELHWLAKNKFLFLARDSGHGRGTGNDNSSTYRHIDIVSTQGTTDLKEQEESGPGIVTVAPNGFLLPDVKTEPYCSFIDINNNTDLARFGLHNGGPYEGELNEKWESLAIVPVPKGAEGYAKQEFYIISISDNDFITQNGFYDFGKTKYSDASGLNVDTQILVWQAHLPDYVTKE